MSRFFKITLTVNWREQDLGYQTANEYSDISKTLPLKNSRVTNSRFREIETTGMYYRITQVCKGGKSLIYEVTQ